MSSRRSARRYESRCWDREMMSLASHTLYCLDLMFHFCWLLPIHGDRLRVNRLGQSICINQVSLINPRGKYIG